MSIMNYAFHIDLGDMAYETWYEMYPKPENAAKQLAGGDQNISEKAVQAVSLCWFK